MNLALSLRMKPFIFLIVSAILPLNPAFSQQDSLVIDPRDLNRSNNNALPPGPSTISGTLVDQHGNPIPGAKVTVKYPDGKQREVDTFTSNEWGIFQVYIFRYGQPYIDLEIRVGKKVCRTIRYSNPGRGMNLGSYREKIECKLKKRKKKNRPGRIRNDEKL